MATVSGFQACSFLGAVGLRFGTYERFLAPSLAH